MSCFLISIIIPTRNRQVYCEAVVRQILKMDNRIQVIVNDNSDTMQLKDAFSDLHNNESLVYNYVPNRISAVENYNMAAGFATGEYLCALGDDDIILPSIIECALWMKENSIDAVKPFKKMNYWWPDERRDEGDAKKYGLLSSSVFSGKCKQSNPYDGVLDVLASGGQGYMASAMIGSYHGLVRMECMNMVKAITGCYYGGCSPDIYSATCLSLLPNIRFMEIDYPISLPGMCPQSTSAASVNGTHVGRLEDAPHFVGMKKPYQWDSRIPRYYSVETIWAEAFIKALTDMKHQDMIEEFFDFQKLYNAMIKNNPMQREEIIRVIGENKIIPITEKNNQKNLCLKTYELVLRGYNRICNRNLKISPCKSIETALFEADRFLGKKANQAKWAKIRATKFEV